MIQLTRDPNTGGLITPFERAAQERARYLASQGFDGPEKFIAEAYSTIAREKRELYEQHERLMHGQANPNYLRDHPDEAAAMAALNKSDGFAATRNWEPFADVPPAQRVTVPAVSPDGLVSTKKAELQAVVGGIMGTDWPLATYDELLRVLRAFKSGGQAVANNGTVSAAVDKASAVQMTAAEYEQQNKDLDAYYRLLAITDIEKLTPGHPDVKALLASGFCQSYEKIVDDVAAAIKQRDLQQAIRDGKPTSDGYSAVRELSDFVGFELFSTLQGVLDGKPIKIMPLGTFYRDSRKLVITEADLREIESNFKADLPRFRVPVNENHKDTGKIGTVKQVEFKNDGPNGPGLYASLALTEEGKQLLTRGRYDAVSPEMLWSKAGATYQDPKTNTKYSNVLVGLALTDKPFFSHEHVALFSDSPTRHNGYTKGVSK